MAGRKVAEALIGACVFAGTLTVLQVLADEDSRPRVALRQWAGEWRDALHERRAFTASVYATLDNLPTARKG